MPDREIVGFRRVEGAQGEVGRILRHENDLDIGRFRVLVQGENTLDGLKCRAFAEDFLLVITLILHIGINAFFAEYPVLFIQLEQRACGYANPQGMRLQRCSCFFGIHRFPKLV